MITGKPSDWATATASSAEESTPSLPGVTGTPAAATVFRAIALSPIARIISELGPMNRMWHDSHTSAKCAFSERNPYPGWIASAAVTSAALMIRGMWR